MNPSAPAIHHRFSKTQWQSKATDVKGDATAFASGLALRIVAGAERAHKQRRDCGGWITARTPRTTTGLVSSASALTNNLVERESLDGEGLLIVV